MNGSASATVDKPCTNEHHLQITRKGYFSGQLQSATQRLLSVQTQSKEQAVVRKAIKKSKCPGSGDCKRFACVECDFVSCFCSESEKRNVKHLETGHQLGCCASKHQDCWYLHCFTCTGTINIFVKDEEEGLIPLTEPKKQVSMVSYPCFRGLFNFGRTCYMNCILQVLIHTPNFSEFFLKTDHQTSFYQLLNQDTVEEPSFLTQFYRLLMMFCKRSSQPICYPEFLYCMWNKLPHVGGDKQHDAHEFLTSILNLFHQDFLRCKNSGALQEDKTLIDRIFLGRLQSEVICKICRHSRYCVDPVWDISLEVVSDKPREVPIELTELLERYTRLEHLDESDLLQCTICSKKTQCTKQLMFHLIPPVLCIQLKRFRHNSRFSSGTCFTKIKRKIRVPEKIDFSQFKISPEDDALTAKRPKRTRYNKSIKRPKPKELYELYAVVTHSGTYNSGHYRTYLKPPKLPSWICFDDTIVRTASQQEVMEAEGYLLFYKKENLPDS